MKATEIRLLMTYLLVGSGVACSESEELKRKIQPQKADNSSYLTELTKSPEMIIFGDSLSTGAVTDPRIVMDPGLLLSQASKGEFPEPDLSLVGDGTSANAHSPIRLYLDEAENSDWFRRSFNGADQNMLQVVETPIYSWGAQLGSYLQVDPSDIVLAAQNGAKVEGLSEEVQAFVAASAQQEGATLPARVFFFFSGNDLCQELEAEGPPTAPKIYGANLLKGIEELIAALPAHADGTHFYFLEHLDVEGMLYASDNLAGKIVPFDSGESGSCIEYINRAPTSWRDLDEGSLRAYGYHPAKFCGNLLAHIEGTDIESSITQEELAAAIAGYREETSALIEGLKVTHQDKNIEFRSILGTGTLAFSPEDLANDCFHLSVYGQRKIAEVVLSEIQ